MEELPNELLCNILHEIPVDFAGLAARTCSLWYSLSNPETRNKLHYLALTESITLLCWALDNGLDNQEYVSCLIAEKGDLELLKQAYCKGFPVNMTTLNLAAKHGHIEVLRWARGHFFVAWQCLFWDLPAENGHFEVLKWAQERQYLLLNCRLFSSAAKGGHLDILKWLKDLGCPIEANEACGYAVEHGHLEVLRWLFEARADYELSADLCAKAAANGHLDVLKWLREKGCPWDDRTCNVAASSGQLQVLRWAYDNECPESDILRNAAAAGHLDVLQWAIDNLWTIFEEETCASAAEGGQLEVLQWLREKQGFAWDEYTCLYAAKSGHLEVLKYATKHGCPWHDGAEYEAYINEHEEVWEWILELMY